MPWMIPPSTWLEAPSGLTMRPDVVNRGDALDAHLAGLDVDRDLDDVDAEGEDAHPGRVRAARALAEDLRLLEHGDDLLRAECPVGHAPRCAAMSSTCSASRRPRPRAPPAPSTAASRSRPRSTRTARAPSRRATTSTCSSGMPSSSAAICAMAVRVPVPMSCIAVITVARPSEPSRTQAYEGGPPPPYQIWLAMPTPCFQSASRARAHLVPPLPVRLGARVALLEVLGGERRAVVRGRVVPAAQLERVDVELRRELVDQALEPERPLDEAGRAERLHRRRVDLRAVA